MTEIEKARKLKDKLEIKIFELVKEFEDETGLSVVEIRNPGSVDSSGSRSTDIIEVEVRL